MIKTDVLHSIRILAFCDVDNETAEAWYNQICRWYSREFHTPLHLVLEMSDEYIIKTYYEDMFYKIKHSDNEDAIKRFQDIKNNILLESKLDNQKTLVEIEEDEDELWYKQELAKIQAETDRKVKENPNLKDTPEQVTFNSDNPEGT